MKSKFLFLLMLPLFLLAGCSKEDDNPADDYDDKTEEAVYYVRYEVSMPNSLDEASATLKYVTFVSERGILDFSTTRDSWSGIFGPFKKGDNVYLEVQSSEQVEGDWYACLSVSRGIEPFVLKDEDFSKGSTVWRTLFVGCVIPGY